MRQNDETPCSEPQIRWLLDAAERGYLDEQYELAMCYLEGNGLEKDYAKAVEWFRKAAEQEHPRAQYELGRCYKNGYGVKTDRKMAAEWFRKAADQGNIDAETALKHIDDDSKPDLGNHNLGSDRDTDKKVNELDLDNLNLGSDSATDNDDSKLDLSDLNLSGDGDADKKAGDLDLGNPHPGDGGAPAGVDIDDLKQFLLNILYSSLIYFIPAVLVCGLITKFSDTPWSTCWGGIGTVFFIIVLSTVFSSFSRHFHDLFYDYEFVSQSGLYTVAVAALLIVTSIVKWISGISWDDALTGGFIVYLIVYISSIVWMYLAKNDDIVESLIPLILISSGIAAFWLVVWALVPNISWEASLQGAFAVYFIGFITTCLSIGVSSSCSDGEEVAGYALALQIYIAVLLVICSIVKWIFGFGWGGCLFFGFIAYVAFIIWAMKKRCI